MKLHQLLVMTLLLVSPAYANDAMTVLQDLGTKWQTAYNSGDAGKVADLYFADAVFSSGVLGTLKGKPEIEKAVANQMKQTPKITVTPMQAWQSGNVVFGFGDFAFADGPSGHYGITVLNNAGLWHIAMHVSNATPKKP
jgi:ketosteroid isomerase-like protein